MHQIIKRSKILGNQVNTPETTIFPQLVSVHLSWSDHTSDIGTAQKKKKKKNDAMNSPSVTVAGRKAHEAVGKVVVTNEATELASKE